MGITKLALQRRHIVELDLLRRYIEKYTKIWTINRPHFEIREIIPFAEPKLWNCFEIRCNYVDDAFMVELECQGYTVAEIKHRGYDRGFAVTVMKTREETIKRFINCLKSPEETSRIEKYLKEHS